MVENELWFKGLHKLAYSSYYNDKKNGALGLHMTESSNKRAAINTPFAGELGQKQQKYLLKLLACQIVENKIHNFNFCHKGPRLWVPP